jgi:hypothetical protein
MSVQILVYEPDLLFSSRIESTGERFGLEVKTMTTMNAVRDSLRAGLPKLLVVNLDVLEERHESLMELVHTGNCKSLGYYSHVNANFAEEALRSGFEIVIPRRALAVKLVEIFAKVSSD